MSTTAGDLRYSLRALRGNPGFTAIAVASLALGIGVTTAIFSLVDQLLLWSVPARDPATLVRIKGGRSMTYPFYREYRDRNQVFTGVFAASNTQITGIRPEGSPAVEIGNVQFVSGNYFETLGVGASIGRTLASSDDVVPGGSPVAVLSDPFWRRRFDSDTRVIGRTIAVNGHPLVIIGVAQHAFTGLVNSRPSDIFVPITMYPVTNPGVAPVWSTPSMHWLNTMARLKPGVSRTQAEAAMRVLWPQAVEAVNDAISRTGGRRRNFDEENITLPPLSFAREDMIDPLKALSIATGLVLLIASANVANLLLARAGRRRREIAVRLALGATRARLIRQLLTESVLLAVIGGIIGLALAYFGVLVLARQNILDPTLRVRPSPAMLAFSIAITLVTGILFGTLPAFRAAGLKLAESFKDGGSAGQSRSRLGLGKALIAGQVALSLALLLAAGLFLRTLHNLRSVDLGFARDNIVIADIDPTKLGYRGHRLRTFYDQLLERTRRIPGVRSAGLSLMTPMGEFAVSRSFSAEGYKPAPGERLLSYSNPVSSGYFATLGIPVLLGRDFETRDEPAVTPRDSLLGAMGRSSGGTNEPPANASRVCIVNESLARKLFGATPAVGRHLSNEDRYNAETALEIIGVVKDVRHGGVHRPDTMGIIYVPSWSNGAEARWLGIRTSGDPRPVLEALRREVRTMDADVPVLRTRTLEDSVNGSLYRERIIAWLSTFFGLLALALAGVGLYGVMASAVTQRTREIGIRMALGARPAEVLGMIVRESMLPVLIGIAIGSAATLAFARLVAGLLYGVAPRDPVSTVFAAVALLLVALVAAIIPGRRASRVEPTNALRHEG